VPESLIDALQGIFPTVGRKPIERGGRGESSRFEVRGSEFEVFGTSNPELRTSERAHIEVILAVFFDPV
jgi:hypothetical protein